MGGCRIGHAHLDRLRCRVAAPEKEDLPSSLLADHARQVGRSVPGVVAGDVGIGLLEEPVLAASDRQVADHVQAVTTTDRPTRHERHHDLGHEPDQTLDLQDVQASQTLIISVLIPVFPANPLVAT